MNYFYKRQGSDIYDKSSLNNEASSFRNSKQKKKAIDNDNITDKPLLLVDHKEKTDENKKIKPQLLTSKLPPEFDLAPRINKKSTLLI